MNLPCRILLFMMKKNKGPKGEIPLMTLHVTHQTRTSNLSLCQIITLKFEGIMEPCRRSQ